MPFRMRIQRIVPGIAAASLLLAAQSGPAAQAARGAAAQSTEVEHRRDTFRQYCASCHGDQAKGNGPASSALKARPTDLTMLAKRKGGFSAAVVEAAIKGISETQATEHEPVPAHGSYAMPVWGPYFSALASNDTEAQRRVTDLVKFIESIQAR